MQNQKKKEVKNKTETQKLNKKLKYQNKKCVLYINWGGLGTTTGRGYHPRLGTLLNSPI